MLQFKIAQVGVDLLGVVMAQLRVAHGERIEVERLGLNNHVASAVTRWRGLRLLSDDLLLLLRLLLLLLLLLKALSGGALPRHAHVRRLCRGCHARTRTLRKQEGGTWAEREERARAEGPRAWRWTMVRDRNAARRLPRVPGLKAAVPR